MTDSVPSSIPDPLPWQQLVVRLYDASMPPASLRVALGLMAIADLYGNVIVEWEQYLTVAQCNDVQAARRHLTRLRQQGIIEYTTNGKVWISIKDWPIDAPESARIRAESTEFSPPAAARDQERAPKPARIRAESTELSNHLSTPPARGRAETGADTRQSGDNYLSKLTKEEEEDRLYELDEIRAALEDAGLNVDNLAIPDHLTYTQAREIIRKFEEDRRSHNNLHLGALAYRIKNARPRRQSAYA